MGIAVLLVFFSAFLPILIGTGASTAPYSAWTDGYFVNLAREIVGPWLSYWLMLASGLTNIGMFEAEMSSDSWQIAGMADRGILPTILGTRNKHDTPTFGIILSASGIIALCWMSFSEVVDMLNLLFCYGQAIEFFAFLYLRLYKPDMPRPFRIPIGFYGMCVMLAFPLAFIVVILYFSSRLALVLSGLLTLFGFILFYVLEWARSNGFCSFEDRYAGQKITPSVVNLQSYQQQSGGSISGTTPPRQFQTDSTNNTDDDSAYPTGLELGADTYDLSRHNGKSTGKNEETVSNVTGKNSTSDRR